MAMKSFFRLVAVWALSCGAALLAEPVYPKAQAPTQTEAVRVKVAHEGDAFIIDAVFIAPVPAREAWAVLTDFDAMSQFVPDLESSRITSRSGTRLTLEQHGTARWGPFTRKFHTVREVDLLPFERVTSRTVGGTLRRADTLTQFTAVNGGTEIRYHMELMTDAPLPDFAIESFLRAEVRQQFGALLQEIRRRGQIPGVPR